MYEKFLPYLRICRGLLQKSSLNAEIKKRCFAILPLTYKSLRTNNGNGFQFKPQILTGDHLCSKCIVLNSRNYAKGKNKPKEKNKVVKIDENELSKAFDIETLFEDFKRPVEKLKTDYVDQITLRTSVGAIESLKVQFEGKDYTVQDLAEIGKKNPKVYVLDFSVFPQVIPEFIKSLEKSGFGVNPQQDGHKLYLEVPKVTREHRETLAKNAKALFNRCKDIIRNIQNDYIKKLSKGNLSEDDVRNITDQIHELAKKSAADAEAMFKAKEKELLQTDS